MRPPQTGQTHKTHAIDLLVGPHILQHIPVIHPLGDNAQLKQPWRNTLDAQEIFVLYSPTDDDLFAITLGKRLW